jgi:hypothetical protein
MGRTNTIDYPTWTKRSFLLGVGLFVFGWLGSTVARTYFGPIPAWELALFVDAEALGILVALLSPLLFGIVLPLTE